MAWLSRVEFGALAVVFCVVLMRLVLREARTLARVRAAEDWVLLAGALLAAARLAFGMEMVETGWVWGFGLVCAAYLAVKGLRATRVEN